ncbi:rab-like protein 3 isoform X2 [Chironomus tepperi]|uniref:rab-like protein 3 isoform X2 n=1 Tax=Chironomus tepperi TaxID=113505 RepID=UPI00391F749D
MSLDKVRIIVVGDSFCGKSSFVNLVANNEILYNSPTTVGCAIEVKLHEYKEDTSQQKQFFIEFFDVGGSMSTMNARSVFYQQTNGIILVHDLTNRKSQQNLKNWLIEIINKDGKDVLKGNNASLEDIDTEQFLGICQIPILVVGTKNDLIDEKQRKLSKNQGFAQEIGADEIYINCRDLRSIQAGSTNAVKLQKFFDKVIERKYVSRDNSTFYEKQRKFVGLQSPSEPSYRYYSPFTSPTVGNYSNFSATLGISNLNSDVSQ